MAENPCWTWFHSLIFLNRADRILASATFSECYCQEEALWWGCDSGHTYSQAASTSALSRRQRTHIEKNRKKRCPDFEAVGHVTATHDSHTHTDMDSRRWISVTSQQTQTEFPPRSQWQILTSALSGLWEETEMFPNWMSQRLWVLVCFTYCLTKTTKKTHFPLLDLRNVTKILFEKDDCRWWDQINNVCHLLSIQPDNCCSYQKKHFKVWLMLINIFKWVTDLSTIWNVCRIDFKDKLKEKL